MNNKQYLLQCIIHTLLNDYRCPVHIMIWPACMLCCNATTVTTHCAVDLIIIKIITPVETWFIIVLSHQCKQLDISVDILQKGIVHTLKMGGKKSYALVSN